MIKTLLQCSALAGVLVAITPNAHAQKSDFVRQPGMVDCKAAPMHVSNTLKDAIDRHNNASFSGRTVEEGFEGDFLPNCWTSIDADGDGNNWFAYSAANSAFEGTFSAASASWLAGAVLTPDNYLVSPLLAVGAGESLVYQIGAQDPSFPEEHYGVYISTTGNTAADFTTQLFSETLVDGAWYERSIDLAAYEGQNVYIAWRHYDSSDWFYIKLDGVVLPGTVVPCADCSGVEYPTIESEAVTCDEAGWLYNLEVSASPGGAFTLSNSANGTTYAITGPTSIQAGPFNNGQAVTFTISLDEEPSCFVSGALTGDCTEPCETFQLGPWNDFNTLGIPVPDAQGNCTPVTITDFEIWAGEAYLLEAMPAGVIYEFNACDGPSAGTWEISYTVLDPSENVVAFGTNADGCSIEWATEEAGDYLLIITRVGYCGTGFQIENGYPSLTCLGLVGTNNLEKVALSVYPNPAADQINVVTPVSGNAQVRIFDATGRLVIASNEVLNGGNFTYNISALETGFYTLQIQTGSSIAVNRFIKE